MSWIAPLVNNRFGDALNIEMRHQQLFFIKGDKVLDNIGYDEKGKRFNEADFGKPINNLDDVDKNGYWFIGKLYDPDAMREALKRQKDGYYYSFFTNQCQDWADRLGRLGAKIEQEWEKEGRKLSIPPHMSASKEAPRSKRISATEPASVGMGVLAIVLGLAAIVTPQISGEAFAWVLGLYFLAAAFFQTIYAFHGNDWRSITPILFTAAMNLGAGLVLLLNTQFAIVAISLLLAIVLGIQGLSHLFLGLFSRPRLNWIGHLLGGLGMLILAILVFLRWPNSGNNLLGIYVGIAFLLGGLSTVILSLRTRGDTS